MLHIKLPKLIYISVPYIVLYILHHWIDISNGNALHNSSFVLSKQWIRIHATPHHHTRPICKYKYKLILFVLAAPQPHLYIARQLGNQAYICVCLPCLCKTHQTLEKIHINVKSILIEFKIVFKIHLIRLENIRSQWCKYAICMACLSISLNNSGV